MSWFTRAVSSSVGKKYIMALTGLLLGGFLLVHAAGNSTIFLGRSVFLAYASHLHALEIAVAIAEMMLLALFLTHIVTGLILFLENRRARTSRYAVCSSAGGSTWGSATMPYTGILVLAFLLLHLVNFRFIDHGASIADIVAGVLSRPLYASLYTIGLGALALHVSHGFWSLFQSAGVNHPKYDRLIRMCAWLVGGLIITLFAAIVLLLLVNSNQLA
ncbi:MAG: succinate dehydrogenase cytochrome b subunit [Desulfobulbaceae bacterium]